MAQGNHNPVSRLGRKGKDKGAALELASALFHENIEELRKRLPHLTDAQFVNFMLKLLEFLAPKPQAVAMELSTNPEIESIADTLRRLSMPPGENEEKKETP